MNRTIVAAATLSVAALLTPIATAAAATAGTDAIYVVGKSNIGINLTWPPNPSKPYDVVVAPGHLTNHGIGMWIGTNPIANNWCVTWQYWDRFAGTWGSVHSRLAQSNTWVGPFDQGGQSVRVSAQFLEFGANLSC